MNIRGIEVEFDFLDADDVERFEKEASEVKRLCQERGQVEMSGFQMIREECQIINNFFDNVFGEGVSEKMFKGKNNLGEHIKAFEDIVNEKIKRQQGLQNTMARYQPNRETRRYNQFKKGNRK